MARAVVPGDPRQEADSDGGAVEASAVCRRFAGRLVVHSLSFSVEPGETFGLVGPNGSGKTTTLRMLLDIIRPDSGCITVLGAPLSDAVKDRIGYLPEERGLYKSVTVEETLLYLAALKDVPQRVAIPRIEELLRRTELWPHRRRKVGELSRGMSQLIGFCAAVQHRPSLLILDEPFSGLDPLNVKLLKEMIVDAGRDGSTIIFSTHQMDDVEELCGRVLMLHHGKRVLYDRLAAIKERYRENSILIEYEGVLGRLRGVERILPRGPASAELLLGSATDPQAILRQLADDGIRILRFELLTPSLNEIFIRVAESRREL